MTPQADRYRVLTAGICALIVALGVARFAYTPLLPLMQRHAGLGVAEAGWLASLNYAGYLSGALIASVIRDPVLKARLFRAGMLLAVITTLMMGLTSGAAVWAVSRYLAGLSSATSLLLGTDLIINWLIRHDHRSELGLHFSGIGLGIAGTAAAVMLMDRWHIDWRRQWYVLTAMAGLLTVPALRWLPAPERSMMTRSGEPMRDAPPGPAFLRLFLAAYFCAGVGYVVSATFIVAIVERLPGLTGHGTLTFLVIGVAAAPSCIVWDRVARRTGELNALMLAAALQIAGILLPLAGGGLLSAIAGAALFGATFMGLVSLVLTMAGRYYPTQPARMMGRMTLSYGIAQIIAPAVTGSLAARHGSYQAGLYLAAGAMAVCTLLFGLLRLMDAKAAEQPGSRAVCTGPAPTARTARAICRPPR